MVVDLLDTTVSPVSVSGTSVFNQAANQGSIGASSFYYRLFTYRIASLRALRVTDQQSRLCLQFASPYRHGYRHFVSLQNISLQVGSDSYYFPDALQESGEVFCWYVRATIASLLEADVTTTLRITASEAAPTVAVVSRPRSGDTYLRGETLRFRVSTQEPVISDGTQTLAVTIGGRVVRAAANRGWFRSYVDFSHTVAAGDVDGNGVSVAANTTEAAQTIRQDGAQIQTRLGVPASLEFRALADQTGHKVRGDSTDTSPPVLQDATVQYRELWLDYNEPLDTSTVPGTSQYTVTANGEATGVQSLAFQSDRRLSLVLGAEVAANDSVVLSSTATIRDAAGNAESPAPTGRAVTNNTPAAPPTLSLSLSSGRVAEGETIGLTLTLSESVLHDVPVTLSYDPGRAFDFAPPTVTIPAGMTEHSVPLATRHLASVSTDTTVTVSAGQSDFYSGTPNVVFVSADRDASYQFRVVASVALASTHEQEGPVSVGVKYTITASGPETGPPEPIVLSIVTESETAKHTEDYVHFSRNVTISSEEFTYSSVNRFWKAELVVPVQILSDDVAEEEESFVLVLMPAPGQLNTADFCRSGVSRRCSTRITIGPNDFAVGVRIEAASGASQATVAESSGQIELYFVGELPAGIENGSALEFTIEAVDGSAELPADYGFSGAAGATTMVRVGSDDWVSVMEGGAAHLEVRKPILLDIGDDGLDEEQENFDVRLGRLVGAVAVDIERIAGKQSVRVAIDDDDERGVVVSPTLVELRPGEMGTYSVNLASQPTGTVTVTLGGPDHEELEASPTSLTFDGDNWETPQAVSVEGTHGFVVPAEDTIAHDLAGADYEGIEAAATTVRAVSVPSSQLAPGIAIADASASEQDGTISFEVKLGTRSTEEVTVRYRTEEGTAEEGKDFTAASGILTFAAGDLSRTIQVTLLDDSSDEETEGFHVTLSNAVNAQIGDDTADGEIEDDDGPPTVSATGGTAGESDESLRFTVTLSTPSSFEVTARYETVEVPEDQGGATEGGDFTARAGFLTIAPGTKHVNVEVPLLDDALDELDETVGLALSTPTNAVLGADQMNSVGIIRDDDDPPNLVVTGGAATEAEGSIAFNVELSTASALLVVAPYLTVDDTATAGADYGSTSGSLTIRPGRTQGVVRVPLYRDVLVEPDETFGLLVDSAAVVGAVYSSGTSDPVGTIRDSPGPGLEIGDAVATEASGTISFPVRILGAASSAVTVDWTTNDGTAVAGSDYTAANGTLTIAAGTGEADIAVVLIEDRTVEDDETFSVVLSNASGAALIDSMGVGTITEDPLPVVSVAAASATESAAALSFGVSVNQAAAREIRVSYQTSDVTATQDEDYLVTSGVLTFAPGDRRKEIAVPIVGDGFDESDETLLLTLSGVRNATLGANPATGTIRDDDEAPIVSVTDAEGTEGGVLTFEVSLSAASRRGATVGYATVAGTATAGDDYTAAEGTLTFDPDVTTRQVRVALEQDSTHEPTETFTVELRSPVNAAVSQTDGSATGAILDDDVRAVVVAPLQISVREGGESSYTVRLATRPVSAVTVEIAVTGSADVSTDPSSLTFTMADWATAQTVGVSAAVDQDRESETASVDHTASGGGYGDVAADSVTVRVSDGDAASTSIALSVDPRSVSENGGIRTVEVKGVLNGATLTEPTVVAVTVQGGTATVTNDFLSVPSFSLTIPADSLEGTATFSLSPVDDDVDEGESETVSVSGTTTADGLTVRATEMAIVDDDERGVVVRPTVLTVAENSTGEYTVALESEPTGPVMVGLTKSGSAGVTVAGTSLTFTDSTWATAQTVIVTASDDADSVNERATVAHTVTLADYSGEPADSVEITVADDERVAGTIALSAAPDAVGEDAGATLVRVTAVLDGAPRNQATAVDVQVGDPADGAVEGTDYQAVNNFTLTIVAGAVSGTATFTLTPLGDQVAEGDETISVRGTTTVQGLTVAGTTVTLEDGDVPPETIVLSVDPGLVSEGDSATTVTVTAAFDGVARAGPTELTGSVGAESDSATETSDYQAVAGFRLTIPAGMRSGTGTFTLTPIDDTLGEGDERISVSGSASGFHVTGTGVALSDNETVSTGVTLRAAPASIGEDDVATSVNVTATLDDAVRPEATTVTVSVGARQDGATEGTDYVMVADFPLTIPAGTASGVGTFILTPIQDTLGEGDESISVDGKAFGLTVTGTAVAMTDDETVSRTITLIAAPSSVREDASATGVEVTAMLDDAARPDATWVTVSVGAPSDSATEGTDYVVVGGMTILIPAGMTSGAGTFTLTPRDDDLAEGDELVSLEGTTTAPGLSVIGAVVTITDDEATPTRIVLSATPPSLRENGGEQAAILTARLDGGARGLATVVTVQVGDSADTATKGIDYGTVPSFEVTIPSGSRLGTAPFRLAPTDDSTYEGSESISVKGAASPALAVTGTHLALIDDERQSDIVTLSVSPSEVAEGAGETSMTVMAALNAAARSADTPVRIDVGASGDDAREGADYTTVDQFTITILAGTLSNTETFLLTPTQDLVDEPAETLSVSGTTSATGLSVNGTEVTITDDDTAGVTVTPTSLTIAEGASDAYTVLLDSQPTADVMVTLSVPGAGGFTADPSVLTFSSTTWDTAQTVTVSATEDADAVAPAPATIGHSAAGGGYDAVTVEGVRVTVTEDDAAGVTVSPTSLTIMEGASDAYTVVLTTPPTANVVVTLSVPGSSGFTADPSVLTFSSTTWDTAQTVTVSATEDADAVAPAPATIGHSAAGGGYDAVTVEGVVVTVTENDAAGVTVTPTSLTITEGASDTYTVVLTTQPTADVMVTLSVPGAGGFTADPSVLTFSSTTWDTVQTVTVSATEDADAVAPAPATIGHSAAGGGYDAVTVEGVLVTVTEDDAAGVTVTPTSLTIMEGASDTYTVVLTTQPTADVMVTLSVPGSRRLHGGPVGADLQLDDLVDGADGDGVGDGGRRRGGACAGDDRPQRGRGRLRRGDRRGRARHGDRGRRGRGHGDADLADDHGGRERHVHGGVDDAADGGRDGDAVGAWRRRLHGGPVGADLQLDDLVDGADGDGVGDGGRRRGGACAGDDRPQRGRGRLRRGDRRGRARHGDRGRRGRGDGVADLADDHGGRERHVHGGVDDAADGGRDGDVVRAWRRRLHGGPVGADVQLDDVVDTAQTVTVSATEDADAVAPAPATIGHSAAGGGYGVVTVDGVLVTVTEDDTAGVTVTPTSLTITEGASDTYTVVLTTPPTADVMVTLSVPGSSGFTADPAVLTFSSTTWSTAQTVTVSATEDADAVAPAPATIGHSAAGGGYDAVTVEGVLVTVTEDDAAGVTVTPTSLTIMEGASDTYTVVLTTQPPADVMVTLSVPGAGGFTADPSVLTFSSTTWDTAQTVTVSATEDADAVAPAPATIGHSAAGGGYGVVTVDGVLVTVTENDAPGVTVSPASLTITEGASDTYTVVLTTPPTADVMVTLSVPGAGGFTADPSVLTFSSTTWSTAQTVTVSATEDADAVAPAPATIGHGAAGGGYDAVTVEGVLVTVTEDDTAGVTVTPTSLTITEGASDTYTVVLTTPPPANVMVTLSVPGAGGFTADPSVLTFSSTTWDTAQTVTVSATEDADAVAPAPATIGHSAAGGGYDAVAVEGVVVTVTEDDTAGVTVTPTSLTITEGASDTYTVVLDTPPTANVMVTLSVPGAGGFTADPSVLTFSSTTWSAAQTVTVSATEDADAVAPAPATIGHSAAGGGYDAVTVEGVVVTVTEDDAAGVTVSPTSLTITEGASDTYTVVLTTPPTADVMVTLSVPGAGGFTADPSVLTFSSTTWSTAQTVTVSATEDADAVAPAPATIGHSAAGGGYDAVTVEGVLVTVTEDDAAGVTVTPTSLTITEGASDTYTVVLTTQPTADVMVTLSVPGAGGFTADPSVLTFSSTTWDDGADRDGVGDRGRRRRGACAGDDRPQRGRGRLRW